MGSIVSRKQPSFNPFTISGLESDYPKSHLSQESDNTNHMKDTRSILWSYLSLLRQIKIEL